MCCQIIYLITWAPLTFKVFLQPLLKKRDAVVSLHYSEKAFLSLLCVGKKKLQKNFFQRSPSVKGLKRYNLLITLWNYSIFTMSISATSCPWDGHLLSSATSLIASCVWRKTHLSCYFQVKMRWGEKGYPEPHKTVQSFRVVWLTPAVVWYLKHSCVWSAWLGASAFLHSGASCGACSTLAAPL